MPSLQHSIEQQYGYPLQSIEHPFRQRFPRTIGIIIAILQMLLNFAIIGLEGGSVAYNPIIDIVYAGFWCSISFFFTWVSMFAFLCFRKVFRWGLVVAGLNLFSIIFAIILIVFDSLFIQYPCQCYLATVCNLQTFSNFQNTTNCIGFNGKQSIVKAQLACAATMLASNLLYILVFIIIAISTRAIIKPTKRSRDPMFMPMSSLQHSSATVLGNAPQRASIDMTPQQPDYYPSAYNYRYRQPIYPSSMGYSTMATPYFNRLDTF